MFIDKYVDVKWSSRNKPHYVERGYNFTKVGDTFSVKIKDIHKNSSAKVLTQCCNCKTEDYRVFRLVYKALAETYRKAYYCSNCIPERVSAEIKARQEAGVLKRGENGYWTFTSNIENEILKHIEKHGNLDNLAKKDTSLDQAIREYDTRELYEILADMNLNFRDYLNITPMSYARDFENIRMDVKAFIDKYDRFPTVDETWYELKIDYRLIQKMGGINEFRKAIGYHANDQLIDDSNYKNRSIFEYKIAQYLIHNEIYAKRDDYPFEDTRHTCDFIVEDTENNKYYIECWGYSERSTNAIAKEYCTNKRLKKKLYEENNLNLISINLDDVNKLNNDELQRFLANKFSIFSSKKLKVFKNVEYLDTSKLSNEDILEIVMKHSNDDSYLPSTVTLRENEPNSLYQLILNRFGSYRDFAVHFGKRTQYGKLVRYNEISAS